METEIYPIMNYVHMRRPRLVVKPVILQYPGVMFSDNYPENADNHTPDKVPGILFKVSGAPQLGELLR